jgi:hypothetical protein
MEKNEKNAKDMKQAFVELENYADVAKEKLRVILRGLSKSDMIARINDLHLSDRSLNFLCEGIALETEDYEICAAVQQIKKDLQDLEIRQAAFSPACYYHTIQQPA